MRKYFIEKFGEDCLDSRETFAFELPFNGSERDVIFDPYNERLKIFGITAKEFRKGEYAESLVDVRNVSGAYTKLTVYALPGEKDVWHHLDFAFEGSILGYFEDSAPARIWTTYLDYSRQIKPDQQNHIRIMETARAKSDKKPVLRKGYKCEIVPSADSTAVSNLLKSQFDDYPTPISSKRIKDLIKSDQSIFRCIRNREGEIVAVASAEIDNKNRNAELTDCATLPDERRKGHMLYILSTLEDDLMKKYGLTGLYSLTRAGEPAINCTFARLGYIYTGRLFNNCRMPDGWESMNIWCKPPAVTDKGGD